MSQHKEQTVKQILESESYQRQKAIIFREINSLNGEARTQFSTSGFPFAPITIGNPGRVNIIDFSVFKKSKHQKEELKLIKSEHKRSLIRHYGSDYNKQLNVPSKSLEGTINL